MDTKALRQKILDLAIRGKLVPQDPKDEPASVLLERIHAEKQQMVKDGKLKPKDIKNDTVIFKGDDNLHYEKFADGSVKCVEDEIPFELPNGWIWNRGHSCFKGMKSLKPQGKYFDYIDIDAIDNKLHKISAAKHLLVKEAPSRASRKLENGSVLFSFVRPYLENIAFVNEKFSHCIASTGFYVCNSNGILNPNFMFVLMTSKYVIDGLNSFMKGNNSPSIRKEEIENFLYPIPPIYEQKRIINKINAMFPIIENLAIQKNNLKKESISFKSKILDLAIRGKLVPQDPNDEPASVLLERIRAEKEELIKQGKIKRNKKESVIFKGSDNSYYLRTGELEESLENWRFNDLPETWEICCLGELCNYGDCINVNTEDITENAWILDLEDIEKDTGTVLKKVTKAQRNSVSTKHKFHSGQVLYSKLRPYLNKVVLSDDDGYCTSEILPLEFKNCVLPEYARYYLMSGTFIAYANHCSYGVKMPRLGTTDGKKAIFSLPPLSEQKRIVKTIDSYFMQLNRISEALT
ncbi:restriction endonuclease subunit S [Ligilactobacillus ruminis]|uniref:restriction endonuclease subunit S n=1 Tax=Ligilactobacillus ruminis TaxID=1623 RepID=UPI003F944349